MMLRGLFILVRYEFMYKILEDYKSHNINQLDTPNDNVN